MEPNLASLDHLVLTVADFDATVRFYAGVLGMRAETFHAMDGTPRHALVFGEQKINLHRAGKEFLPAARYPTPGSADLCFLSEWPVEDWQEHLACAGIDILAGPVPRSGATGAILSIYVRDPDGNLVEISHPHTR